MQSNSSIGTRLIIRPGAIGDFILSLPAMERWGRRSPAPVEVWTAEQNVPLARFAGRAASIISMGLDRLGLLPADDVIDRLRAFDEILSWYGTGRPEFRELVASLRLPFHFLQQPLACPVHAVDFYLEQVGEPPGAAPRLDCRVEPAELAIIHPFASSPQKRWPLARFEDLARRLEARMPVRWCCGPQEHYPGAVQIPNLYDLACWIARARVFIGNDSGISHLAAAAGTPVIALFGPTNPAIWSPRGPSVRIIAKNRLEEIAVDEVDAAVG